MRYGEIATLQRSAKARHFHCAVALLLCAGKGRSKCRSKSLRSIGRLMRNVSTAQSLCSYAQKKSLQMSLEIATLHRSAKARRFYCAVALLLCAEKSRSKCRSKKPPRKCATEKSLRSIGRLRPVVSTAQSPCSYAQKKSLQMSLQETSAQMRYGEIATLHRSAKARRFYCAVACSYAQKKSLQMSLQETSAQMRYGEIATLQRSH